MGLKEGEVRYDPLPTHEGESLINSREDDGKFPEKPVYRDLMFAVLFVIHLVAVVVLLGVNVRNNETSMDKNNTTTTISTDFILRSLGICAITVGVAFLFSFVWLSIMKSFAKQLIYLTLIFSVLIWVVAALLSFANHIMVAGVFFLFLALLHGVIYLVWRKRIPFATVMLQTVAGLLKTYPAPSVFAYLSVVIGFVWLLLWVPSFALSQQYHSNAGTAMSVFLILSFYWVSQVIKNVVHVTASGLFATWYFMSGTYGMPANPTLKSFKRAMTTSFGSICFGSLLVAILKTLRQLVSMMRGRNVFLRCIAECILAILDRILNYFNMYAFTQVAIYGKSYCEAAKDTWHLLKTHGIDALVNDNLISGVLLMGSLLGGIVCAIVGGVAGYLIFSPLQEEGVWVFYAIIGFLIGVSLVMLAMEVVESGVATIFVCFAMDAPALERNSPDLYHTFRHALDSKV